MEKMRWIFTLVAASLLLQYTVACVPSPSQGDSCSSLQDLLFTTFHVSGGRSQSTIHASTFYLDAEQAHIACKRRGMQLVEVSSRTMFDSIVYSLDGINPYDSQAFLIAGRYDNGSYMLENGQQLPSTLPWHQGEPSRTKGNHNEDCLVLERRNGHFRLNDVRCWNVDSRYLCADTVVTK